jgi:chromosome segregation ATPase
MEDNAELARLEQFIDKLLAKYKKLQEMYALLDENLAARNAECEKLEEQLAELRTERTTVGKRVAGLIDRIEQWEVDLTEEEASSRMEQEGIQKKLFEGDAEAAG